MSFAALKKQSKAGSLTERLMKKLRNSTKKVEVILMNVFGNHL